MFLRVVLAWKAETLCEPSGGRPAWVQRKRTGERTDLTAFKKSDVWKVVGRPKLGLVGVARDWRSTSVRFYNCCLLNVSLLFITLLQTLSPQWAKTSCFKWHEDRGVCVWGGGTHCFLTVGVGWLTGSRVQFQTLLKWKGLRKFW